jgi:hypothetical protein
MLRTRELPFAEWSRLVGTELETIWPSVNPETATVLVVEDEGQIVGTWMVMTVVHAEGVWIAPSHRGRGSVARRLLRGLREIAARAGVAGVVTGAKTDDVAGYLARVGARPVPGVPYYLPMRRDDKGA